MQLRNCLKAAMLMAIGSPAFASEDLDALALTMSDEDSISLATGYKQQLLEAPVTATIVTRKRIEELGGQSLADILDHVSGLHQFRTPDGRGSAFSLRGRRRTVLLLVDGIPYVRGLVNGWMDLEDVPVHDIERIEVVRGPSSAVYGADAAGGVLNIITRTGLNRPEIDVGARVGSFQSAGGWARGGIELGDWNANAYVSKASTDTQDSVIEADAQSAYDRALGTRASLAPGKLNLHREVLDARVALNNDVWKLSASRFAVTNYHTGAGITLALDPSGTYDSVLDAISLSYQGDANKTYVSSGYVSLSRVLQTGNLTFFPPGAFRGLFPQGVLQESKAHEERLLAEYTGTYNGIEKHSLRGGIGLKRATFFADNDIRNFVLRNGLIINTGRFAEGAGVGDTPVVQDTRQEAIYGFLMDEWIFSTDWRLSAGVRLDHYNTWGSTWNPRISGIWIPSPHVSIKVQYATAFTPPSLTATSSNGTFSGLGDPDLIPQKTKMLETVVEYNNNRWRTSLTGFWYADKDLVELVPSAVSVNGLSFVNAAHTEGYGIEYSAELKATDSVNIGMTYAFQNQTATTERSNTSKAVMPKHRLTTHGSWQFLPSLSINANTVTVKGRERPAPDMRIAPSDYTLVGAHLQWNPIQVLDVKAGAKNLFNADAREIESASTLPNDLPLPGRQYFAQVEYRFGR